ncbi:MAG: hypothetical protein QOH21_701 [Acidobacteriota bacterium]|jgi:hypothetical protein|nr:hypothetical protein [Acidobacteriota bacterium]
MPVFAVCPACLAASEFRYVPVTHCLHCETAMPVPLQDAVRAALARERAPRPSLLSLGTIGSFAVAGMALLFLLLAPFDIGTYSIEGEAVSGPEFLRRAGIFLGLICGLCFAIGYALLRERAWSRPLMIVYWVVVAIGMVLLGWNSSNGEFSCNLLFTAIPLPIAAWYLYRKADVVRYYDALTFSDAIRPAPPSGPSVSA